MDDIVADIMQRLKARLEDPPHTLLRDIESDVRADWGGDRPYIARSDESQRTWLGIRNQRIVYAYQHGDSVSLLARRHGVCRARIYQILERALGV